MKKILAICLCLSGCATIMNGSKQEVPVNSLPQGAKIRLNHDYSEEVCRTPCFLNLPRKNHHIIHISKEGYEPKSIMVSNSISGWIWGNLLVGLIGLPVDFISGGAYKLDTKSINTDLEKIDKK